MWGGFPWPLFPMGFALMHLLRVVARKQDIIDEHVRDLQKKERKELRKREGEV
jgi:hypothetical protein